MKGMPWGLVMETEQRKAACAVARAPGGARRSVGPAVVLLSQICVPGREHQSG